MSLNELKPDIVSGQVLQRLQDASVFAQVANSDYQGEITNFGQSVTIAEIGPVTISSYTMGTTADLTIESLPTASKVLQINQAKTYAFSIEDADNAQAIAKVLNDGLSEAAWGIRDSIDAYAAGLAGDAGIAVTGTSSTGTDTPSTNILVQFMEAARLHDEQNTPAESRWCVAPAWYCQKAALAGIVQKTENAGVFAGGARLLGDVYGFQLWSSNNVVATSGTDRYPVLFGYRGSITMAVQVLTSEVVRPSKQFTTLAKGLAVYGAKVIRPNNLGVAYVDYTAEAT